MLFRQHIHGCIEKVLRMYHTHDMQLRYLQYIVSASQLHTHRSKLTQRVFQCRVLHPDMLSRLHERHARRGIHTVSTLLLLMHSLPEADEAINEISSHGDQDDE